MAESSSNVSSRRSQTDLNRVEDLVNKNWPGGVDRLISEYQSKNVTPVMVKRKCGVWYRGFVRLLESRSITPFDKSEAMKIGRRLNPSWNENISRAKIQNPFHHSPEVIAAANKKRIATFRNDPSRHGQSYIKMTNREQQVADMLEKHGIKHKFNQPTGHYFLDFYLPEIQIGIEAQRSTRRPDFLRDREICDRLGLRTCVYFPNLYLFAGHLHFAESFFKTIATQHDSLATTIGDSRFVCHKPAQIEVYWFGFGFKRRWQNYVPTMEHFRTQPLAE